MNLLGWAIAALILAFTSGAIGFSGVGTRAGRVAKILFLVFAVAFLVCVILTLLHGSGGGH